MNVSYVWTTKKNCRVLHLPFGDLPHALARLLLSWYQSDVPSQNLNVGSYGTIYHHEYEKSRYKSDDYAVPDSSSHYGIGYDNVRHNKCGNGKDADSRNGSDRCN